MVCFRHAWLIAALAVVCTVSGLPANEFSLQLRHQEVPTGGAMFSRVSRNETWRADETAVIVCDVWDYHHCLNAVRRLAEFAPRLNDVLAEARRRGAVVIHAPSDCMPAYEHHPARLRATRVPKAQPMPAEIRNWCSRIETEARAVYPIDQSDGGEDDEPQEHQRWSAELASLGRNPAMPWKAQSPLLTIDGEQDYLSDRGDEVWSILRHRGIKHVILTGVHANMCVLGRPFGLRQMVRNGMHVALMRDMTDSMYNPQRWPHVDHFTGHDLVISHVERYVCPTLTSDQLLGGQPFRFKSDQRSRRDVAEIEMPRPDAVEDLEKTWNVITIPSDWPTATGGVVKEYAGTAWYRCVVRVPEGDAPTPLTVHHEAGEAVKQAWLNGHALTRVRTDDGSGFAIEPGFIATGDANLLVLRVEHAAGNATLRAAPVFSYGDTRTTLAGKWQFRLGPGDERHWSNMPLPTRFGAPTDIVFPLYREAARQ